MEAEKKEDHLPEKKVLTETLIHQVATTLLTGATLADCAKSIGVPVGDVRRATRTRRYKELVEKLMKEDLAPNIARTKAKLTMLSDKAVRVISKVMDKYLEEGEGARDALQSAATVLRSVGLHEEKEAQSDQTINIIMPSGVDVPITYTNPDGFSRKTYGEDGEEI